MTAPCLLLLRPNLRRTTLVWAWLFAGIFSVLFSGFLTGLCEGLLACLSSSVSGSVLPEDAVTEVLCFPVPVCDMVLLSTDDLDAGASPLLLSSEYPERSTSVTLDAFLGLDCFLLDLGVLVLILLIGFSTRTGVSTS